MHVHSSTHNQSCSEILFAHAIARLFDDYHSSTCSTTQMHACNEGMDTTLSASKMTSSELYYLHVMIAMQAWSHMYVHALQHFCTYVCTYTCTWSIRKLESVWVSCFSTIVNLQQLVRYNSHAQRCWVVRETHCYVCKSIDYVHRKHRSVHVCILHCVNVTNHL